MHLSANGQSRWLINQADQPFLLLDSMFMCLFNHSDRKDALVTKSNKAGQMISCTLSSLRFDHYTITHMFETVKACDHSNGGQ